jgi:hypothetical protein
MSAPDRHAPPVPVPWTYKGVPVPYIAAWSTERESDIASGDLVLRTEVSTGRAHRDEHALDRDRHGILWHRVAWAPGQGKPLFADVHTTRQRRVMSRALCQVCAGPAEIWMTPALLWDAHLAQHGPRAPYPTNDPPVCRRCASLAAACCPELARGHLYLAPGSWAITGVRGQIADPVRGGFGPPRVLDLPGATTAPEHTALRLMLAKGLVATLYHAESHTDPGRVHGLGQRRGDQSAATRRDR